MKARLIFLLTIVLFMMGCNEDYKIAPVASFLTGSNTEFDSEEFEYVGRLGAKINKTTVGVTAQILENADDDRQFLGAYATQDLVLDPNMPLLGNWYLGGHASLDIENDNGLYGPILGLKIPIYGITMITEYQYRLYNDALAKLENGDDRDDHKVFAGMLFEF